MENGYKGKEARSKTTYSRLVKAGNRNYYIDGKEDSKGSRYIVLSEVKSKDTEGHAERHRIFVYEEDFARFSEAFLDVVQALGGSIVEEGEEREITFPRLVEEETQLSTQTIEDDSETVEPLQINSIHIDW